MKINNYNVDSSKIFLRSSNKGVSYEGFRRKRVGAWNKAKNWKGIRTCNKCGGFFGIDKEFNGFGISYRRTVEMCEWRGKRIPINNDKICVSEYRVVAVNEDIPDSVFKQCDYNILRNGKYKQKISVGRWIIFGGKVKGISGGHQYFWNKFSIDNAEITGGHQHFGGRSSAGNARISGGYQYFWDKSSIGNAKITGGRQSLYNKSSAGNAKITGGNQHFSYKSSLDNAKICGGCQYLYNGSFGGNVEIIGGCQYFHDNFSAGNAKIIGGDQHFWGVSSAGNAKISGGHQYFNIKSSIGNAKITGGEQDFDSKSSADMAKIIASASIPKMSHVDRIRRCGMLYDLKNK